MRRLYAIAIAAMLFSAPRASADPSALVVLATAKQSSLAPDITAYGTVAADTSHTLTVAAPRESVIVQIAVRAGQPVNMGDAIATIASSPASATQYQQASSTLGFAAKDLAHIKELFAEQLATRSQVAAAEKAYSDAQAQVREQQRIGADRETQTLRAPAGGIVSAISGSPGDRVAQGALIASIATRNRFVLNVGLEPEDAPNVPIGASVRLYSSQNSQLNFSGTVLSVSGMMDAQSRLVNAAVAVPQNDAPRLILGMVLQADIRLPPKPGVVVPKAALMTDSGGTYVFVVAKGAAHRRNVSLTLETGRQALVARGVAPNDAVVVAGNAGLQDGMAVRTH
jgi:RND family efflux transporter MFP subunit